MDNEKKFINILFIGNGFDIEHEIKILLKDFVESSQFKKYMKSYKKYFFEINYKKYFSSELWSELENYIFKINCENKLKETTFIKKINLAFNEWLSIKILEINCSNFKSDKIKKILLEYSIYSIISFNYTNTPKNYEFDEFDINILTTKDDFKISNLKNKYIKIHSFKNKKKYQYVLGNDNFRKNNKDYIISKWDSNKDFNPKELLLENLLKSNLSQIIFYGFSFGISDKKITLFLFELFKKNLKLKIIIYYFESAKKIRKQILEQLKYKKGIKIFNKNLIFKNINSIKF